MESKTPTFEQCLETIRQLCADKNFPEEELRHRARLLYLMNKLNFWEDFPVLLEELYYQRKNGTKK